MNRNNNKKKIYKHIIYIVKDNDENNDCRNDDNNDDVNVDEN